MSPSWRGWGRERGDSEACRGNLESKKEGAKGPKKETEKEARTHTEGRENREVETLKQGGRPLCTNAEDP